MSSPVLSPEAFSASRAGTFPGISGDGPSAETRLEWWATGSPRTKRRADVVPT